jgi:hypothetical protein
MVKIRELIIDAYEATGASTAPKRMKSNLTELV